MTPTISPLAGSRLKIERAKRHVHELESELIAFRDRKPYGFFTEDDPSTGDKVYRVNIIEEVPAIWSTIIGDAIHNMRAALDLLATEVVVANGGNGNSAYFPFADTVEHFEAVELPKKVRGASQEAIDLIKSLKPYKGGNKPLWQIHRLDRLDKHQAIIPVGSANTGIIPVLGQGLPPKAAEMAAKVQIMLRPADRQYPLKNGAEVYRVMAGVRANAGSDPKIAFDVAFGEGQIVEGEPVLPTLVQFGQLTEQIIDTFGRVIFNEPPK